MNETVKTVAAVAILLGCFAVSGLGVYKGSMNVETALAVCLSALSSAGVLSALFNVKKED